jgi:hypothetical protein
MSQRRTSQNYIQRFFERLIDSVTAIQTEIFPEIKINMNNEIKQKILTSND